MSLLDRAHAEAARLTPSSTAADVRDVLALFRRAAWPDDGRREPGTIAWFMADLLPKWMAERAGAEITRVLYFGCIGGAGHYLHDDRTRRHFRRDAQGQPWDAIDGSLCPPGPQLEGRALVHHRDGWTALAFWDRSVDHRGNSNSAFFIDATVDFPDALQAAKDAWPEVFARFTFEVTPA